jgi:hypothetical protein
LILSLASFHSQSRATEFSGTALLEDARLAESGENSTGINDDNEIPMMEVKFLVVAGV